MNPSFQGTDHIRQVVFQIRPIRTGTEGNTVVRIVHHLHHPQDVLFVDDDSGKPENAPCRIVRMDRHVNIILIAHRHDFFQKILQIGKQLLSVHILIHLKKLFYPCHTLRLPARHYRSVRVFRDRRKHLLRVQRVHRFLRVGKHCGTVRPYPCQLRSCPVKHRHEIVTYHVDALFA